MRRSLGFKLLLVGGILLVLQIPLAMTYGVRAAREGTPGGCSAKLPPNGATSR